MSTAPGSAGWVVTEAPVPRSLGDDDAWAVHAEAALERAVQTDTRGRADLATPATTTLAALHDRRHNERTLLVVTPADRPRDLVGATVLRAPQVGNAHLVAADLLVHPSHRRRGVGSALLAEVERRARAMDRSLVVIDSEHGPEPEPGDPAALTPPTGSGRIRSTDPFPRFAARHGLSLEQAERHSVLGLPVDPGHLRRLRAEAQSAAGPDYRVVAWRDRCPEEWVDGLAVLETRMSTDAPRPDIEVTEDPWDADRVRAVEAVRLVSGSTLTTAVVHTPTGTLAGFTALTLTHDRPEVAYQEDTLVLREHRGHRLGQLVKVLNLQWLAEVRPEARRVHTWNAEENSHMLRINVALGFRPAGIDGLWVKTLA